MPGHSHPQDKDLQDLVFLWWHSQWDGKRTAKGGSYNYAIMAFAALGTMHLPAYRYRYEFNRVNGMQCHVSIILTFNH